MKSKDECAICLNNMNVKNERIRLFCGHFFHTSCLSKIQKAECPLCRADFLPIQAYKIFKSNVIKPIVLQTFAMPKDIHGFLLNCMRLTNSIGQRGQWHASVLHQIMTLIEQHGNDSFKLSNALLVFSQALST
jgi:hypothetical protein